ncbi:MAG: hypothetical protein J0L63_02865 [Anaerolineae bacterium]|nr:hypothetical protein [Anaerolineae bacterium]
MWGAPGIGGERREAACLALLAAGNTVLAAAMRQWQREDARLPPTMKGRMREEGELPQTNAAISAIQCVEGKGDV